jgi:hypothetical protein
MSRFITAEARITAIPAVITDPIHRKTGSPEESGRVDRFQRAGIFQPLASEQLSHMH